MVFRLLFMWLWTDLILNGILWQKIDKCPKTTLLGTMEFMSQEILNHPTKIKIVLCKGQWMNKYQRCFVGGLCKEWWMSKYQRCFLGGHPIKPPNITDKNWQLVAEGMAMSESARSAEHTTNALVVLKKQGYLQHHHHYLSKNVQRDRYVMVRWENAPWNVSFVLSRACILVSHAKCILSIHTQQGTWYTTIQKPFLRDLELICRFFK